MARSLGVLTLDLIAKTASWTAGMSKAERDTEKFKRKFKKDMDSAISTSKLFAAASIATAAYFVKATMDQIAAQNDLANQLKTTYAGLAVANRAADLSGISAEKMAASSRKLTLALSKSADETTNEAKALDRLGLSASALMDMPLDKRISAINEAIKSQIPALEQASVAATLFGSKSGVAISKINPEALKMAAREVNAFGLNLSEIDVSKIADAEDKLGRFPMALQGIGNQLTVSVSPALSAVSDMFLDLAEANGTFASEATLAADIFVNSFGAVGDAIGGVTRLIKIVGSSAIIVGISVDNFFIKIIEGWTRLANVATFGWLDDEVKSLEGVSERAGNAVKEMKENIASGMEGDSFSDEMKKRIELAKENAKLAAEQMKEEQKKNAELLKSKRITEKQLEDAKKLADEIAKEIEQLERERDVFGKTAEKIKLYDMAKKGASDAQLDIIAGIQKEIAEKERLKKAQDDLIKSFDDENKARDEINKNAKEIVDSLKSEEDAIRDSYEDRRKIILAATFQTEQERIETLKELKEKENKELGELNNDFWQNWLEAAKENLADFDALSESVINNFSSGFGDAFEAIIIDAKSSREAFKELAESMVRNIVNAVGQIIAQWMAMKLVGSLLDNASNAEAVASAAGAGAGIASAMAPAAAMTSLATSGANSVAAQAGITSTVGMSQALALSGMAHDGIDRVPATGTWLLQKGERVVTEKTSAKLDRMLSGVSQNKGMGTTVNVNNAPPGTTTKKRIAPDGREIIDVIIGDMRSGGPISRTMQNTFGFNRVGA